MDYHQRSILGFMHLYLQISLVFNVILATRWKKIKKSKVELSKLREDEVL